MIPFLICNIIVYIRNIKYHLIFFFNISDINIMIFNNYFENVIHSFFVKLYFLPTKNITKLRFFVKIIWNTVTKISNGYSIAFVLQTKIAFIIFLSILKNLLLQKYNFFIYLTQLFHDFQISFTNTSLYLI